MSIGINGAGWSREDQITMARPLSEPSSSFGTVFSGMASAAGQVAGSIFGGGISLENMGLIQEQMKAQKEMFLVSLYSNIEKSKHETQMAAVRNVRVG